ncbi:MAG: DUF2371 domain-containing protein [Ruminococcaceae bacterium]|nr:DUF2371 domain-containing protein [Oscillospiraceae bacterium]
MISNIIGAVVVAVVGVGVAFVNYLISKTVLEKIPDKYSATTVLRQIVQIAFLVIVYFISKKTNYDPMYLLVGAVLGITVPMFIFTKKLLTLNETLRSKEKRKEEEVDG